MANNYYNGKIIFTLLTKFIAFYLFLIQIYVQNFILKWFFSKIVKTQFNKLLQFWNSVNITMNIFFYLNDFLRLSKEFSQTKRLWKNGIFRTNKKFIYSLELIGIKYNN